MKYSKQIVDKICSIIAEDDYTINEICLQVGISRAVFFQWKNDKIDFLDAIKKAEEQRLEVFKKAARSGLLMLLQGKEYEEVTTEYKQIKVGTGEDGLPIYKPRMVSQKKVKKFIMPNPTSVIFTAKNLDNENFSDIQKIAHEGSLNSLIQVEIVSPIEE